MITLIFVDGEFKYDNHIIIFFETLKNHVEDFGYSAKINLKGIEIKKEEFDIILNTYEEFVKNDYVCEIIGTKRREIVEDYLGISVKRCTDRSFVEYCAKNGSLDMLKYAHDNGSRLTKNTCMYAAQNGHIECLKYAHEHGCLWNEQTIMRAAQNGHIECLKYACEQGCFNKSNPLTYYGDLHTWNNWIMSNGENITNECIKYMDEHGILRIIF